MPNPYGKCTFINDASYEELFAVLKVHKSLIKEKYTSGDGIEVSGSQRLLETSITEYFYKAYVDYGDLGMDPEILRLKAKATNGNGNGVTLTNGKASNGASLKNGTSNGDTAVPPAAANGVFKVADCLL